MGSWEALLDENMYEYGSITSTKLSFENGAISIFGRKWNLGAAALVDAGVQPAVGWAVAVFVRTGAYKIFRRVIQYRPLRTRPVISFGVAPQRHTL